jgi:hypothetical protein
MKKQKLLNLLYITSAIALLAGSSNIFAGNLPDTGDPNEPVCNPRSYTDAGNGIIVDNVTGLMWQKETAPSTYRWPQAARYCNRLTLGGYTDWRLPTIQELITLVDSSVAFPGPTINTDYFPDTVADNYWSSTTDKNLPFNNKWCVYFRTGFVVKYNMLKEGISVRAVRGSLSRNDFIDNADGTITDASTGLVWEKSTSAVTYTWDQAKDYCDNLILGGESDWRLPTRIELHTLLDYRRYFPPVINRCYFPETVADQYWASTAPPEGTSACWIDFGIGYDGYTYKTDSLYVRAVRGGRCSD